jgi:transcriptional regulator with XRE-family HTH domain
VDAMTVKDIGKLMRDRRVALGLTLLDIAKFVGVSESTVSRWESGNIANMKRNNISSLSKILRMSPLEFIDGAALDNVPNWYDPEATEIAQAMKENPGMRVIFDASRHVPAETLKAIAATIKTFTKKPEPEDYSQELEKTDTTNNVTKK